MLLRHLLVGAALPLMAACGASTNNASEADVQKALWAEPGPAKLTLFTVESTNTGTGAHSALLVSGSHRALFDPAGTFYHPAAPERDDVHFGITPTILAVYVDYHARETFNVRVQEVEVSPEVADRALSLIQDNGPVPKAHCNVAVTRILSQLPGFEDVPRGYRPMKTANWMSSYPGVAQRLVTDDDADDNHGVLIRATEVDYFQDDR